jgi:hypothetical protein
MHQLAPNLFVGSRFEFELARIRTLTTLLRGKVIIQKVEEPLDVNI